MGGWGGGRREVQVNPSGSAISNQERVISDSAAVLKPHSVQLPLMTCLLYLFLIYEKPCINSYFGIVRFY